jgi:hypothetical protein
MYYLVHTRIFIYLNYYNMRVIPIEYSPDTAMVRLNPGEDHNLPLDTSPRMAVINLLTLGDPNVSLGSIPNEKYAE